MKQIQYKDQNNKNYIKILIVLFVMIFILLFVQLILSNLSSRLNNAISEIEDLNDAYHIGASYFLKLKNYGGDFDKLWNYHIKGILTEYLRGNPNAQEELTKLKAAYDKAEELKA